MPIYEYQCQGCGHRLEALQKISDAPLQECPACHESTLKKLVSAASFRLKGSGWYETDFKKDKRKQLADSDSKDGGEGKSENKSDAAADKSSAGGDTQKAGAAADKADKSDTGKSAAAKSPADNKASSDNSSDKKSGS